MKEDTKKGFEKFAKLFEHEEKKAKKRYSIADTYNSETSKEPLYTLKDLHKTQANKDTIIPNQLNND